jgi:pimeloyl-ACP methyl ester carboxylesterase
LVTVPQGRTTPITTPGAPVTAVYWGTGRFALFVADPLGGVLTTTGDPQSDFRGWDPVPPVSTTPGAPITAVRWGPGLGNQIALFVANPSGQVLTTVGDPQTGFGDPNSVPQGSTAPISTPGAPITAVRWGPGLGNQIALFVANPSGLVLTTVGDPQTGFSRNWTSVSHDRTTPGAPITAVPFRNQIALFMADFSGEVLTNVGDPQTGFRGWMSVSQGRTMPGAPVTAVSVFSGGRHSHLVSIDLFIADPLGGVFTTTGDPLTGYGPWKLVSQFPPAPANYQLGVLPPELTPTIPEGDDIILYIHGGPGSRLEECSDLVGQLHIAGANLDPPKRFTVIAFDQPSQGYTSMLGPNDIVPTHDQIGDYYPTLQFSEDFIVAFVHALDNIATITKRGIFIIGGSTGGALALRMGHLAESWIKAIVAWSPASVWRTYANDVLKGAVLHSGFARSDHGEDPGRRGEFFDQAFGETVIEYPFIDVRVQPNPEEWYRGDRYYYYPLSPGASEWPCKWDRIAAARLDYEEVYNWRFRRWHWRLGTELLLFSFFNDNWEGPAHDADLPQAANYWRITRPTLLVAAEDDDWNTGLDLNLGFSFPWENRWTRTREMAQLMQDSGGQTPGRTLLLPNTGHSIHNERPKLFAQQIVAFLSSPDLAPPFKVLPLFPPSMMPDEDRDCLERPSQLSQYPRLLPDLLDKPVSVYAMTKPANLGGDFSGGESPGTYGLRLNKALSDVAAERNPALAMGHAAARYYRFDPTWSAFADLAVTGRDSYESLRNQPPTDDLIKGAAMDILATVFSISQPDPTKLAEAVLSAKTRAYKVAWVLRDPDLAEGIRLRPAWGWIAVSGEDDSPARPVNVSSGIPIFGPDGKTRISAHPQFEIGVQMPQSELEIGVHMPQYPAYYPVSFQVRYSIASPPT